MPVMLPPGRLRLPTSPISTGSEPIAKAIGIDLVAPAAAIAACEEIAAIALT
jgi:hypothetical protein